MFHVQAISNSGVDIQYNNYGFSLQMFHFTLNVSVRF